MTSELVVIASRHLRREAYFRVRHLKTAAPGAPTVAVYFHEGYMTPQEYEYCRERETGGTEVLSDQLRADILSRDTPCGLVFVSVPGRPGEITEALLMAYVRFLAEELRARVEDGLGGPVRRALTGYSDGGFFSLAASGAFPDLAALSAYGPAKTTYINNPRHGLATIGPIGAGGLALFCGSRDEFFFTVGQLHNRLLGQGVEHQYTVWPDLEHNFYYSLELIAADMHRILGVLVAEPSS